MTLSIAAQATSPRGRVCRLFRATGDPRLAPVSSEDPRDQFDEKAAGTAMIGTILFCLVAGVGVGVFFEQPVIGGLAGAVAGIVIGLWLVPRLLAERG